MTLSQIQQLLATINGIISVYSIVLILNIYWLYNAKKAKGKINGEKDYGLVWLAVAFFSWTLTGIISINFPSQYSIVSFLSIGNNGIFICAFAFFDHGIDALTKSSHRNKFFLTAASITALIICLNLFLIGAGHRQYADYIEAIFSTLTLTGFAGILFNSFYARKIYGIAFVSLSIVCLVIFSQLASLIGLTGNPVLKSAIDIASQSLLQTIVISLSFSWIIEKIEEKYDTDTNIKGRKIVEEFSKNIEGFQNFLRDRISSNELELALLSLKEYYKEKFDKDNLNTIILKMSDFYRIENQLRNGIINKNESSIEMNVIKSVLLELIDKLK